MKAIVTGATGGIGEALIEILIKNGYEIIAVGRNLKKLQELEIRYPRILKGYSIDLNDEKEIDRFLTEIENEDIGMIINGAGIGEIDFFENISYSTLKDMIDINVIALTKFTKFFYNRMIKRENGIIVNISSTAGFQQGGPLMSVYYATKAYVNSFTLSLYEEGREKGVKVFILAPGPTKTNFKGMEGELSYLEKFYVTSPQEVAQEFWSGLNRDKIIIIPGKINKLLYFIDRFLPLKMKLKSIKKIQNKKLLKKLKK